MGNTERLVSAVLAHAERRPDTEWDTVTETMTRDAIAVVIRVGGARTPNQAVRAMQRHLDMLAMAYAVRELVPA